MTPYFFTASGKKFYPLDPQVEHVDVNVIASHLSKMTRWTGATKGDEIYTVAQHVVIASLMCDPSVSLETLHHDDSEAYLIDVARPVKYSPGFMENYLLHERRLTEVINKALGIYFDESTHALVKEADDRMLATEARDLITLPAGGEAEWNATGIYFSRAYDFRIDSSSSRPGDYEIWSPRVARETYLYRHHHLMRLRRRTIG